MPEEKETAISNEECEQFINLVRVDPGIYDVTSTKYKDAQMLRNVYGRALPEPWEKEKSVVNTETCIF